MPESIEFLSPRLVGNRFDQHSIPLEVLKDLAALEELIVEVAKWHYLRSNKDRKRIPKGFVDQVSLKITGINEGSAIPLIALTIASAVGDTLFPMDQREYFERARDSIIAAVDAAERNLPVNEFLTDSHLAYFDRIGRSLREGESLELNAANRERPARLNRSTRKYLTLAAASAEGYTDEVSLRGIVTEASVRKNSFELQVPGLVIRGPISPEHMETILDALKKGTAGVGVSVQGIGRFSRKGQLGSLESLEHVSMLDPMDVGARLDEFRLLRKGWFEGRGIVPPASELDWLTDAFDANYSVALPSPYLFPTADGGVLAEWTAGPWEISLDIELPGRKAYWHALNEQTDDDNERELDLRQASDWKWLSGALAKLLGVNL